MDAYHLEQAAKEAEEVWESGGDKARTRAILKALSVLLQHESDKQAERVLKQFRKEG
jgi:hypothetical protein